jgi:hypothetical protein
MNNEKDDKLVKTLIKRFESWKDDNAENNRRFKASLKFSNGNSDNNWQWDEGDAQTRRADRMPLLTINKVKPHNLQLTNSAKRNKSSPKVIPVDSEADVRIADIYNGIIRHIEAQSGANSAYNTAFEYCVDANIGYWRICTDYVDESSKAQDIFIKRVKNPLNVFLEEGNEADGSDATWGGFFEDMGKDEFEDKYPDRPESLTCSWSDMDDGWMKEEEIRVCEYYYFDDDEETEDTEYPETETTAKTTTKKQLKWCLIAGHEILERRDIEGKYIPIVRVVGDEKIIDGKTVRTAHTDSMISSQQLYNFWASSAAHFVKLQGKQPYIGSAEAIRGYEKYWNNLDNSNHAMLLTNAFDDDGNPLPPPKRQEPPVMAQAFITGMQLASADIQAVSGQYDAQLGENVNEQSGVALQAVQRKGENSSYNFTEGFDIAKRYTAMILIDLIPKIYDTQRIARIIGEDGSKEEAMIDPEQQEGVREVNIDGQIKEIYNLGVGRYDVVPSTGGSYESRRQAASDGMLAMTQANPQLWQTHGDLIAKAQDWPMADEFAERSKKLMPPGIIEDKNQKQPQIPPEVQQQLQQAQQQAEQSQQMIKMLDETIQKMKEQLDSKQFEMKKLEIDQYNAETNRMKVVQPMAPENDHEETIRVLDQTIQNMLMHQSQQQPQPQQGPQDQTQPTQNATTNLE